MKNLDVLVVACRKSMVVLSGVNFVISELLCSHLSLEPPGEQIWPPADQSISISLDVLPPSLTLSAGTLRSVRLKSRQRQEALDQSASFDSTVSDCL